MRVSSLLRPVVEGSGCMVDNPDITFRPGAFPVVEFHWIRWRHNNRVSTKGYAAFGGLGGESGAELSVSSCFGPQNRYTTLVWRFLPVAVEIDVRPEIPGLERTRTTDQKFSARAIFWEA